MKTVDFSRHFLLRIDRDTMKPDSQGEYSLTEKAILPVSIYDTDSLLEKSKNILMTQTVFSDGSYKRPPMFFCDYSNIQEEDKRVFLDYLAATTQNFKKTMRCVFSEALVAGQGSLLIDNEFLIRESCIEFLAHGIVPDGFLRREEHFFLKESNVRRIETPTLLLERPWHRNYGHWLVDSAAMASIMPRISMPGNWSVVVGEQSNAVMKRVIHESLHSILPNVEILEKPENEIWSFRELHYITPVHVPPLYKNPEAISTLRAYMARPHLSKRSSFRRVFFKRGDNATRILENEASVIDFLSRRGFEIVDYEERSLDKQCAIFRECEIVIGVKGATLTNCLFCTNDSHLLTLSPADFPDPFFWDLSSHAGMKYSEIFGELTTQDRPKSHNSFNINLEILSSALDRIETDIKNSDNLRHHP